MPTVATLTILSKLQNDIKGAENKLAAECHSKIGQVVVKYDNFAALVGQSSNYLMPGQKIRITGGLGAYSTNNTPTVNINGTNVAVSNGQGSAEFDGGGAGPHSASVTVTFKDQDGKTQTKTEKVEWTVGQPGSASVSADLMNAIYIGVPNPMSVGTSAGWDKTSVNWGGLSASGSTGRYSVTPGGPERTVNIGVTSDGKSSSFPFRVKYLPPATAYIGGNKNGGAMPSAAFKAQGGISATLENTPFNAVYYVTGYTVATNGKNGYQEAANTGNRWSGSAATLINGCAPGSSVIITNIRVKGPDGREIQAANPSMSFILR